MFEQAPEWISRSPRIRKVAGKIWRAFLRVQRATLADAVLVVRREDDCVLAATTASGEVRLPSIELNGWEPVGTQVQRWLELTARIDNAASDSGTSLRGQARRRSPRCRTLILWLSAPLTKTHALGKIGPSRRIVRGNHGVIVRQAPFLPVFLG